ncbi:MAG: hypothetical protein AB1742_01835 [bacterium]
MITREDVVETIRKYLQREITVTALVDWAESAMMDGEFDVKHFDDIRNVISRLGLADVRAFGLTWEDCDGLLGTLGYSTHVEIVVA